MKYLLPLVLCLSAVLSAQNTVRVHLVEPKAGFVDAATKSRDETRKDLAGRLAKKNKVLRLVPEAEAQVIVELQSVQMVDGSLQTTPNLGGGVETKAAKTFEGKALLKVGDYQTEIVKQGVFTTIVAARIADEVEQWVKDNRSRLP